MTIVGLAGYPLPSTADSKERPTVPGQSSWSGPATVPTESLLNEREKTHGDWEVQSAWSQKLKQLLTETPNWEHLPPGMKEAFHLKSTKWTRILHGDPLEPDHWWDDAGYSQLIARNLK